jgi:hypothetical protein
MFIVEKVTSSDCSLPLGGAFEIAWETIKGLLASLDKVIFDKKDSSIVSEATM